MEHADVSRCSDRRRGCCRISARACAWPCAGPPCAVLGRRAADVVCAAGQARRAGRGQRLCRARGREPQPAARRSDVPPLLRPGRAARAGAAFARVGRDRRRLRPRHDQQSRHRECDRGEGLAGRQARTRSRDRAQGRAHRSRGAAHQEQQRTVSRACRSPIPTKCRSATWCWPSAIRSASARP